MLQFLQDANFSQSWAGDTLELKNTETKLFQQMEVINDSWTLFFKKWTLGTICFFVKIQLTCFTIKIYLHLSNTVKSLEYLGHMKVAIRYSEEEKVKHYG